MTLADADPRWTALGRLACTALEPHFREIEHVGSTSVPGLAAKPVIDLMASVDDLDAVDVDTLDAMGFRLRPEVVMPERLFLRREDPDGMVYHLHIVTVESWPTRNERLLRDYLREHPEDAARYAALKRELMARHGAGDAYTRGKTDLVQELTDKARAERGLPSVPVWED
jgi:GrpB-like predicted nucleotidyltransferase (UPF0157 family)